MASTEPELMAASPSDTLRKLRSQMIAGDVVDRLSAITTLLTTLIDKEIVHEARVDRDKKAADLVAKAQEKAQEAATAAAAKKSASDEDDAEAPPPAAAAKPAAGATARR